MSLFDKNIVEKEISYDPDPRRNIEVQIKHYLNEILHFCVKQTKTTWLELNVCEWILYMLDNFMRTLLEEEMPDDWKGPYEKILSYHIIQLHPLNNKINGLEVRYQFNKEQNWNSIMFYF